MIVPRLDVHNCCPWCLRTGERVVETLHHAFFQCPAYKDIRSNCELARVQGDVFFNMSRDTQTWGRLKEAKQLLQGIWSRRTQLAGRGGRSVRLAIQAEVNANW